MSVEYILDRFGKKVGMLPSDTSQRALLLDYLNEAAQELYEQSDMPGSLEEAEFYVQGDKTIAMPSDVYTIREIREKGSNHDMWETVPLTERYRENNWSADHNKFRVKATALYSVRCRQVLLERLTQQTNCVLNILVLLQQVRLLI